MHNDSLKTLFAAVLLTIGLALCGWFIGQGFVHSRLDDKFVTVKGVAERTVRADLAIWPMRFVATGNDLTQVHASLDADARKVVEFLLRHGISREAVELQSLEVTDVMAQAYRSGPVESRFILAQTMVARSGNVDTIAQASQRVNELVDAGVVLSAEYGPGGPVYLFTSLNDVKPEMIAEATLNAREAAQQFATDSGSRLGDIRRANQGVFQILGRNDIPDLQEHKQIEKTVRVVSTIDYYLVK
ncbi:MAG TPA: SIMPL domain-containing protein [Desulfonatronum sp.]|nr:SIMPL domain-containing protein [Desulfonatronum sp.]